MKESAALARSYPGVRLHTHLAENALDVSYSLEKFARTPSEYAESLGWTGPDVWHAHCVQLDDPGVQSFAQSKTGIAHCPTSNMRLGSGAMPLRKMLAAGVPIGLGVDGAASNDSCNMLHEARSALLLARATERNAAALTARQPLFFAKPIPSITASSKAKPLWTKATSPPATLARSFRRLRPCRPSLPFMTIAYIEPFTISANLPRRLIEALG